MKQLYIALLFVLTTATIVSAKAIPYFSMRSQSENAARELVLWQTQINLYDQNTINGSFSLTPEYERSFKTKKLAQALFGDILEPECQNNQCPHFAVQGSLANANPQGRNSHALLADYFGLPTDYDSTVNINPQIDNFLIDIDLYLGLDQIMEGLYFRAHAPLVHTRWSLNFCEHINNEGKNNNPTGYFNGAVLGTQPNVYGVARTDLVGSFEGFITRKEVTNIEGITFQPLSKARMYEGHQTKTALSEIQVALGWNFLLDEDYHFGINIRGSIPTGTRPVGKWLFEPIVGNGRHGEVGAGFSMHWILWQSEDECRNFALYTDINVTHLFNARQCRTFDLCQKPFSRYMLAEKMVQPAEDLVDALGNTPTYQFENEFAPVANISTIPVEVNAAAQADIAIKFGYTHVNWEMDFGYECWVRSCEKIRPISSNCEDTTFWALKGDAFVYGFADLQSPEPIPLSANEQDATIFCGTNNAQRYGNPVWLLNPGVDSASPAFYSINPDEIMIGNYVGGELTQMYSSFNLFSVFSNTDRGILDIDGAQTRGLSNKLFGNVGYLWKSCCYCTPYLGLGAELEFGKTNQISCCDQPSVCLTKSPEPGGSPNRCATSCNNQNVVCTNSCSGCKKCPFVSLSQWGIWVKTGVSF